MGHGGDHQVALHGPGGHGRRHAGAVVHKVLRFLPVGNPCLDFWRESQQEDGGEEGGCGATGEETLYRIRQLLITRTLRFFAPEPSTEKPPSGGFFLWVDAVF